MDNTKGLDKASTDRDAKLKEMVAHKLLQVSQMLGYVSVFRTTRDYMYFGWKLNDGNVKIYDLLKDENFLENAKRLGIKYAVTKKEIIFTRG